MTRFVELAHYTDIVIPSVARDLFATLRESKLPTVGLRIGDWRVIYTLKHEALTVIVIRVGHRREIYE